MWEAWRDSEDHPALHLALLTPLLSGDVEHGINLLNGPFTGRDDVFLLAMYIPIQRQGWLDLPGQRQAREPPLP